MISEQNTPKTLCADGRMIKIDQLKIKATSATPEVSREYSNAIKALQLKG
jgi:hypothetical protein